MQRLHERLGIEHWSNTERAHALAMLLITAGAVWHHCVLFDWYIEDAAISFAYAKHLAMGEGLVPFIGGERVEGYSNPAWVFFLAPFSWIFDLHESVRWIQVALVIPTVLFTWFASREVLGRDEHLTLVAPAIFAVSAQGALWGGAGLEIGLMNLLMSAAIWRTLVELRTQRWPWSALLWLGVTLCRPEAILYAAVAGFSTMIFTLVAGRGIVPTLQWLLTFFLPYGLYQAWRYQYFAWELPNTYYAKLERRSEFPLLDWGGKSWRYTRNFLHELGWGFFLPVWALGVVGHRGWRLPVAVAACLAVGLCVELSGDQRFLVPVLLGGLLVAFWWGLRQTEAEPPRRIARAGLGVAVGLLLLAEVARWQFDFVPSAVPTPDGFDEIPPYVLISVGALLPVLSYGSRGWQGRMLTWLLCCAAILFALIAQWDWMKGFRWYAPAVVPASILFSLGTHSLVQVLQDALGPRDQRLPILAYATAALLVGASVVPNVLHTIEVAKAPDTRPTHIRARVNYVDRVRDRLQVEERWVDLDVDQGGHLYWSDFEMMDIAGLVEVPLSHHKFEKPFIKQYLFEERRPHFIHIHGGWASSSRIPSQPEFRRNYVEIPGYIANTKEFHIGNHVRRDLVLPENWDHGSDPIMLEGGVLLHGVWVPSHPAEAGWLYVEVGMSATRPVKRKERDDFRVVLFATNNAGAFHSWEVAPGYDWIWPHEWKGHEMFVGKLNLRIPESLPIGAYDLGMAVISPEGKVLGPTVQDDVAADGVSPVFAHGEVLYPDALQIVSKEDAHRLSDEAVGQAVESAKADRCEEAATHWFHARKHRLYDSAWTRRHRASVRRALANCHARGVDTADTRDARVQALVKAREFDHWAPEYRARHAALAKELYDEGIALREAATTPEDWEPVFHAFNDAVRVDRRWSWARRYAEEARALWLEIDEGSLAAKEAKRQERLEESRRRREKLAEERAAATRAKKAKEATPTNAQGALK